MKIRLSLLMILALLAALSVTSVTRADGPAAVGILEAGAFATCGLMSSGAADCWGYPTVPQSGDQPGPYTQISAGGNHNCALTTGGAADCWGNNLWGGAYDRPGPYTQVSAGNGHSCALTPSGAVDCWGYNEQGGADDQPGPYTQISAGNSHTCALTPSGAADCWGHNQWGQADDQPGPYTQISAGNAHTCALTPAGAADCWGINDWGQAVDQPGPYTQISAGAYVTCALTPSDAVDCWGYGAYGAVDQPGPYTQVSVGAWHVCALTPSGGADCWGDNYWGQSYDQPGPYGPYIPSANAAPVADPGGPYLGAVNTAIQFDGSLSSDPEGNPLTYNWSFGDGSAADGSMPNHTYTAAGLYDVCLTVNDGSLSSGESCTLAVVYDPSAGFVTGGGWIDSPAGAYLADPALSGKATFGFVAKYKKGETFPSGNTAFEFDLAGMAFASQSYEWLVVNQGGTNAQFKGSGLINGLPDPDGNAYKFMLWAGDNSPDTFRIRIWWEDAAGEHDVYDNDFDQAIGAGNIVVHKGN